MAQKKSKASFFLFVLVAVIAVFFYRYYEGGFDFLNKREADVVDGTIELHFIDVAQADAILIRGEDGNILIDSGDLDTKNDLKEYINKLGITEIEYAIFTHPHADHIGGADVILTSFDVHNVILPVVDDEDIPTTKVYERMITAIADDETINAIEAKPDSEYSVGDVKIKILAPNSDNYSDLNNYSVVVRVDFGATSFMFTGDAEDVSEREILDRYPASELKCTLYKAAHHGAAESNTAEFLKAVGPEIIAISCGEGNSYGHPHAEAMERFENTGAVIYRTDLLGTLKFISDGTTLTKID